MERPSSSQPLGLLFVLLFPRAQPWGWLRAHAGSSSPSSAFDIREEGKEDREKAGRGEADGRRFNGCEKKKKKKNSKAKIHVNTTNSAREKAAL
ncbi:uncharacterized protein VTP21DRAFT_1485 [Calcarisporiella thermophila]|uniref:uncharacterized protein n=1 Tax=Calcarisporiella thermophila TaxID=911321 RepID=UPI0037425358